MRRAVVVATVLECVTFAALGGYSILLGALLYGRVDAFANDLNFLAGLLLLAIAGGFATAAFFLKRAWRDDWIIGSVFQVITTVPAAWAAIWFGVAEAMSDPSYDVGWIGWSALAVAALVIATGAGVLGTLGMLLVRRVRSRGGGAGI